MLRLARRLLLHKAQEGLTVQRGSGARTHVEQDSGSRGFGSYWAAGKATSGFGTGMQTEARLEELETFRFRV